MTSPVVIQSADTAIALCRWANRNVRGIKKIAWFGVPPEQMVEKANKLSRSIGTKLVARGLAEVKAKKGFRLAITCQKCGRTLSNPESVAAGVGPECMAGGA